MRGVQIVISLTWLVFLLTHVIQMYVNYNGFIMMERRLNEGTPSTEFLRDIESGWLTLVKLSSTADRLKLLSRG